MVPFVEMARAALTQPPDRIVQALAGAPVF